jgi:hypothetical protein
MAGDSFSFGHNPPDILENTDGASYIVLMRRYRFRSGSDIKIT